MEGNDEEEEGDAEKQGIGDRSWEGRNGYGGGGADKVRSSYVSYRWEKVSERWVMVSGWWKGVGCVLKVRDTEGTIGRGWNGAETCGRCRIGTEGVRNSAELGGVQWKLKTQW